MSFFFVGFNFLPMVELTIFFAVFRSANIKNQLRPICQEDFTKAIERASGIDTAGVLDPFDSFN